MDHLRRSFPLLLSCSALGGQRVRRSRLQVHPLELVDDAYCETEPDQVGLAAEGDFLHIALSSGVRTLAEKDHITDSIAHQRHVFAFK